MSDTILALLGFATVIAVIVLLLRNVTVPALAFVSVSTITAAILVATGAFTLDLSRRASRASTVRLSCSSSPSCSSAS